MEQVAWQLSGAAPGGHSFRIVRDECLGLLACTSLLPQAFPYFYVPYPPDLPQDPAEGERRAPCMRVGSASAAGWAKLLG